MKKLGSRLEKGPMNPSTIQDLQRSARRYTDRKKPSDPALSRAILEHVHFHKRPFYTITKGRYKFYLFQFPDKEGQSCVILHTMKCWKDPEFADEYTELHQRIMNTRKFQYVEGYPVSEEDIRDIRKISDNKGPFDFSQ